MNKFLFLLLIPFLATAQIPNASFEGWADGEPDGWWTSNVMEIAVPVTQSSDAYSGDYAIKGEVVPFLTTNYVPTIQSGDASGSYIDIDQKYTSLRGYYKFFSQDTNDLFQGTISIADSGVTAIFGLGFLTTKINAASYTPFEIEIEYYTEAVPEKMAIYFTIGSDSIPRRGTYFILDDLSLSTVTGLEKHLVPNPKTFSLKQNYPNPFNPTTKINYQLPVSGYTKIIVYDINGREVRTLLDRDHASGSYSIDFDGSALPSGVYFYTLTAGALSETKRMLLVK